MNRRILLPGTAGAGFRYTAVTEGAERIKRSGPPQMCIMAQEGGALLFCIQKIRMLYTKKIRIQLDNIIGI